MASSFTVKYSQPVREIKTDCGVSYAFDRNKPLRPSFIKYTALWDTGASATVISRKVVEDLNLKPVGIQKVYHANGESMVHKYLISLKLPNDVGFSALCVSEGVLHGMDVLIGMDVIGNGDFTITNKDTTIFTFQVPSTHETDYVKESVPSRKSQSKTTRKVGRNEQCPCGSGKKYKHCCGRLK